MRFLFKIKYSLVVALLGTIIQEATFAEDGKPFTSIEKFHQKLGFEVYEPNDILSIQIRKILESSKKLEFSEVGKWRGKSYDHFGYTIIDFLKLKPTFIPQFYNFSNLGPTVMGVTRGRVILRISGDEGSVEILLSKGEGFWTIQYQDISTGKMSHSWTVSPTLVTTIIEEITQSSHRREKGSVKAP